MSVDLDHLTLKQAAERNGLSVSFLRRHMYTDEPHLPFKRFGRAIRIERAALARWLALFQDPGVADFSELLERVRRAAA